MAKANYKYFIGFFYNDHKAKPLHIMLPKTSAYVKSYDRQKIDVFFAWRWWWCIKKCITIWDKVIADSKK